MERLKRIKGRAKEINNNNEKATIDYLLLTISSTRSVHNTVSSSPKQKDAVISKRGRFGHVYSTGVSTASRLPPPLPPALYVCAHACSEKYTQSSTNGAAPSVPQQCISILPPPLHNHMYIYFSFKNDDLITGTPMEPFQTGEREREAPRGQ